MLHGTRDLIVPYINGKRVYERAQAVGLPSVLITLDGAAHVPWDVIFSPNILRQTMQAVADGIDLVHAQPPPGCVPNIAT